MKNWTEELELGSGWRVRLRPVPPLASVAVLSGKQYEYPTVPKRAVATLGGEEKVDAAEDSPEMTEYWRKCREIDRKRERDGADFTYDYGFVAWSQDGKKWDGQPPKDWAIPEPIRRRLDSEPDPRLAWIKFSLIGSNEDLRQINEVLYSIRPVTAQEVVSAEATFQD